MGSRSLPEDSVVASIGQVQDMIRDDVRPKRRPVAEKLRPVPQALAVEMVGGVPSAAEIYAGRNARWTEDHSAVTLVPVVRRDRPWGRVLLALAMALAGGAGGWFLSTWLHAPAAGEGRCARALDAVAQVGALGLAAQRIETMAADADRAQAEARRLTLENGRLAADLAAAKAAVPEEKAPAAAEAESPGPKKHRAKHASARRAEPREAAKKRRRPPKRMTRTDHNLSSLIEDL